MFWDSFTQGMLLACYIVIPIGAISILYIKRTLQNGILSGIISSLGVTTAEGFYASAAIYEMSVISHFLIEWSFILQLCGVAFLVSLGIKNCLFDSKIQMERKKKNNLPYDYFSMLFFTLLNPLTLVGFIAIFTTFGANYFNPESNNSFAMLCGFVTMSFSYCMFLVGVTSILRAKFLSNDYQLMRMMIRISGFVIIAFTIYNFLFSWATN